MALQKTINVKWWYTAEYLLVNDLKIDKSNNILSWKLLLFKDQEIREKDFSQYMECFLFFYEITEEEMQTNLFSLSYKKIKESVLNELDEETNKLYWNNQGYWFWDAVDV